MCQQNGLKLLCTAYIYGQITWDVGSDEYRQHHVLYQLTNVIAGAVAYKCGLVTMVATWSIVLI